MDITLALGGGGAKGNSHIGVLRRLESEGFNIRSVAGTSFGGIVAVMYALGNPPAMIQKIFEEVDQHHLYARDPEDGPSLLGFAGVRKMLERALGEKTFTDLQIPCAVTAVDINMGSEVILSEGKLKDAVLATIALPGVFPVQHLNDWQLVDGGVLDPVPVAAARMLSPGLPVVAVVLNDMIDNPVRGYTIPIPDIIPKTIAKRINRISLAQSLDVFLRSVDVSSRAVANFRLQLDKPDVIIRPKVQHLSILDQVVVAEVAQLGEDAVEEALPQLKRAASWHFRLGRKLFGTN
ncbi:MAG TPA: patatin-like phospholipase family protein [Anaerolineales bacterium]|nr:patatin-like phospholipase family protein [Anaerolineales bacterium]